MTERFASSTESTEVSYKTNSKAANQGMSGHDAVQCEEATETLG